MSITLRDFSSFGNKPKSTTTFVDSNLVVTYSRVSSKEQHDTNLSLETQNKAMQEYARRNGKTIVASLEALMKAPRPMAAKSSNECWITLARTKERSARYLCI